MGVGQKGAKSVYTGESLGEKETGTDGAMEGWKEGEKKEIRQGRMDSLLPEQLLESKQLDNVQVCLTHFKENRKKRGKSSRNSGMVTQI